MIRLLIQLNSRKLGEPSQGHFQNIIRLNFSEVKNFHQTSSCCRGVVTVADHLNYFIDVSNGNEQAINEMQTASCNFFAVTASSSDHVDSVINEHLDEMLEPHGDRLSVNERYSVDIKRVFHWREFKKLFQNRFGRKRTLTFDHKIKPGIPIGEVHDVGNTLEFLGYDQVFNPFDNPLRADVGGKLSDDDSPLPRADLVNFCARPNPKCALTRLVGITNAPKPNDYATCCEVWTRDKGHELIECGFGVV